MTPLLLSLCLAAQPAAPADPRPVRVPAIPVQSTPAPGQPLPAPQPEILTPQPGPNDLPPPLPVTPPNPPAVPALPTTPAVPALPAMRVPTLPEFASSFQPLPGIYEATILHPVTKRPVNVTFRLPEGLPRKVHVHRRSLSFDYAKHEVTLIFRIGGKVDVRYD